MRVFMLYLQIRCLHSHPQNGGIRRPSLVYILVPPNNITLAPQPPARTHSYLAREQECVREAETKRKTDMRLKQEHGALASPPLLTLSTLNPNPKPV
jgi:hypothetical protein